ncbi:MAG: hypothetical protein AAGC95_13030 [Pseudomonadota bacterium]
MKLLKILGGLVVVVVVVAGGGFLMMQNAIKQFDRPALVDCADSTQAACDAVFTSASGSLDYRLVKPENGASPQAMLVVLHGAGLTAAGQYWLSNGNLQALATREEILVLLADAGGEIQVWKDGENLHHPVAQKLPDQLPVLLDLIESLAADYGFDRRDVSLVGYSNGGTMSMRIACEAEIPFRSVGSFGSPVSKYQIEKGCAHATPAMINHGTKDITNRFEGGYSRFLWMETREYEGHPIDPQISSPRTIEFWRDVNGCSTVSDTSTLPDSDPKDGTLTQIVTYNDCSSGAPVAHAIVENGGHSVPGDRTLPLVLRVMTGGKHANDYSGYDVFWTFSKEFYDKN